MGSIGEFSWYYHMQTALIRTKLSRYIPKMVHRSHSLYAKQIIAYVTLAAVAAAAQSAVLSEFGQSELQWIKICNMYGKFCTQVGEGIASSLVVSLSMVAISGMSAFNLFRLYGNSKGKNCGRW